MERLSLKHLIFVLLLTGCQIAEVGNNESIELIPDLSEPNNEEVFEIDQIVEVEEIETPTPEIISIWELLKKEASIKEYEIDDLTLYYMNQHLKNVDLFENYLNNSYYFIYYVIEELQRNNLPVELAFLPFIESSYDPFSISSSGAVGLWQIMPKTAELLGLKENWWVEERHNPFKSTDAAIRYLDYLYKRFNKDIYLVLVAYNAGPTFTSKAIQKNSRRAANISYKDLSLSVQTRNYIPKFLALIELINNNEKYNIELPEIPYLKVVDKISFEEQIEILKFSDFLNIKPELLYKLNAGYTKWATDPNMVSTFYIPVENKIKYETNGQEYVQAQKINWISHDVLKGESLWALAKKYRTKIDIIRQVNQLESDALSINQILLIPVGQASSNILIPFEAHVVSEGDTLWSLSRKFGVSRKKIMDINNLDDESILKIGQVLNIGNKNIYRNIESKKRTILYSVKQGDNLSKISKLFNVSIKTIRQDNDNLDIIRPGQILKITIKAF
tara:strand:+ start:723 stop:2231 length:1509 start_codon:yes stop_codon:yes gene_type:complete